MKAIYKEVLVNRSTIKFEPPDTFVVYSYGIFRNKNDIVEMRFNTKGNLHGLSIVYFDGEKDIGLEYRNGKYIRTEYYKY